jgi:FkbM family methyltransferase
MKGREIFYLLGFRPAPRTYGSEVIVFDLPRDGRIEYARWLHPRETAKTFSQESVGQLRRFLSPGDVAIDIGAHTGDSAIPMALAVGKSGAVLALEPNPYVFPVLKKNSELNRNAMTIIPLPFAATAEDGEYEFEYGDAGFCNGGLHENVSRWKHGLAFKLKVTGKNLAKYLAAEHPDLLPRIRYIKVDAEGYDLAVLMSLSGILEGYHPFLRAEVFKWTKRPQRERLLRFLLAAGYQAWRVESEANYRGEALTPERLMDWAHYDLFAAPAGPAAFLMSESRIKLGRDGRENHED